jgi:hypothetical protein
MNSTFELHININGNNKFLKQVSSLDEARNISKKRSKPKKSFYWVRYKADPNFVETYDL